MCLNSTKHFAERLSLGIDTCCSIRHNLRILLQTVKHSINRCNPDQTIFNAQYQSFRTHCNSFRRKKWKKNMGQKYINVHINTQAQCTCILYANMHTIWYKQKKHININTPKHTCIHTDIKIYTHMQTKKKTHTHTYIYITYMHI